MKSKVAQPARQCRRDCLVEVRKYRAYGDAKDELDDEGFGKKWCSGAALKVAHLTVGLSEQIGQFALTEAKSAPQNTQPVGMKWQLRHCSELSLFDFHGSGKRDLRLDVET
jgi:hypothetical protein